MSQATSKSHVTVTPSDRFPKQLPRGEPGLVSVVIPCYNQAQFLDEAIESVLAQTYPHHEVLVVDDGSADETAEVAAVYPPVRYIHQKNAGVASARNAGLQQSHGEYLVFLDADDRLVPEALEIGIACLCQHPEAAFASGGCRLIAADGLLLDERPKQAHIQSDHYLELLRGNYIWCPGSVIYRRNIFDSIAGFEPSLEPAEDYDLYLRVTRAFPIVSHDHFVADYRLHSASRSTDHSLMLRRTFKALDRQWDFVKENDRLIDAFKAGKKSWKEHYQGSQIADRVLEVVDANLPPDANVAVATGGKNELLKLGGRHALHFPQANANPSGRLFGQGPEGSTDIYWIQAGMRYEFRLFGGPEYSKELAAISVTGIPKAKPSTPPAPIKPNQAWLSAVPNPVPVTSRFGRTTISWNTGDGSDGRIYLSQGGNYDNRQPADSQEAINQLEAIRARGAQYLLLPVTASWWLDYYPRFRQHLEKRYPVVVQDQRTCIIFDLSEALHESRK